MNNPIIPPSRFYSLLLVLMIVISTPYRHVYAQSIENRRVPVSLIGVHHLGPQYVIYRFYVNKSIGDNIGEGGGGGSEVCCITLPTKWDPALRVDIRWEVDHIIRSHDAKLQDSAEMKGIYQAQVPVEKYSKIGDLYIHFFPNGRVRAVVSSISSDGEKHPIRQGDAKASQTAIAGKEISDLFTPEEIAEMSRKADQERKLHGDWR
jgi:hypothetical protein